MRLAVMAFSALGTAFAALEMPALRWNDDPLGNDALVAFVSDATYGVRGTWESVTADGRSVCIGPPITANGFALPETRLPREPRPAWPGVAETVTADGRAVCVAPEDAPVSSVIDVAQDQAPHADVSRPARSGLDLEPLGDPRYGAVLVEREVFYMRRLTRQSALTPACHRSMC